MAPIVFRGETVGLLEFYRAVARPWTGAEIDTVRLLAHALGPAVGPAAAGDGGGGSDLQWTPDALGATSRP
jgi:hypothetical protein